MLHIAATTPQALQQADASDAFLFAATTDIDESASVAGQEEAMAQVLALEQCKTYNGLLKSLFGAKEFRRIVTLSHMCSQPLTEGKSSVAPERP